MAPKTRPAPAKANTKAKVTKPAAPKKAAATKPAPKKSATTTKAATKKSAPTKAAPKKTIATTTSTAPKTSTKRKRNDEEEDAPEPVKKARKTAPKKTATAIKAAATKKTATTKKAATTQKSAPTTKAAPKKSASTTAPKTSTKRKRDDDATPAPAPAKQAKVMKKGAVINEPPTQRLHVYVFGEGTAGELGLGTAKKAVDVKRPRLNPNLAADKVGVVQISAGGMHVVALTHDNKILTWGVNDGGALGRDTTWEGGLKDADAPEEDDDDDEDDDNGLNPHECTPAEVDFSTTPLPEGTRWVQVAAGDSCSFALTDDGRVYGWGQFRGNEGILAFAPGVEAAHRPMLVPDLKNIKQIVAGANHALALDTKGSVFAWGSGQQSQLGRRVVERTKMGGLNPREFGLPKGPKKGIVAIETGSYHSFAISKTGDVYGWGLNNFGETGIPDNAGNDDAVITKPQVIESLRGKEVISIKGGGHHSIAATAEGDCLTWGRVDGHQMGIPKDDIRKMPEDDFMLDVHDDPRIVLVPSKVTAVQGAVRHVATSTDTNIVVTEEGKAWAWGFSGNYQTGTGEIDDVKVPTMIDNTAVRDVKLNGAYSGGQYSILTAAAEP